jgi:glutamyl-Q tRNA(Asp) synthetase
LKRRSAGNSPNASFRTATTSIDKPARIDRQGDQPHRPASGYRGRFAPSPTGPLHFGSLVTATASYLQALSAGGEWLLRIEDIDPPREMPGAADQIIETLGTHGFEWSGAITFQSRHRARFEAVTNSLLERELAFPCTCSRRQVRALATTGALGPVYPGTCRQRRLTSTEPPYAIRLRTPGHPIAFDDRLRGRVESTLERDIGDFIIRRADGLVAYSLAVVVDDHDQGISDVVRGDDLLDFTPAQIYLQQTLGFNPPTYLHVPVAVDQAGEKLSKQTGAKPVNAATPADNLHRCLEFLGQAPPEGIRAAPVAEIWSWAQSNWRLAPLTRRVN